MTFSDFLTNTSLGQTTSRIAELLHLSGGRAMLVGGAVRDLLRLTSTKQCASTIDDADLEVYGLSQEQIHQALAPEFSLSQVGASFAVFKVNHHNIDLSLPRRDSKTGPGHRGFRVAIEPSLSFAEAAQRRDLTINAIMFDLLEKKIIDPWNGQGDLDNKIIRHVSDQFQEDNLRVLRVMQFAARFDFKVAPETIAICQTMPQDDLPQERLAAEWEKMLLRGIKPSRGLQFLRDCHWLRYYPELLALVDCPQNPDWHPEGDVWNHTLLAMDMLATRKTGLDDDDLVLALALLCHDFGKPATTIRQANGKLISHGHDLQGQTLAENFVRRIWRQLDLPEKVAPLVACHMRFADLSRAQISDQAIRRLAVDAKRIDLLHILAECDFLATLPQDPQPTLDAFRQVAARAQELAVAKQAPKPIIQGRHLQALGLTPGISFKRILNNCYQAQLDGSFHDQEQALAWLKDKLSTLRKET